MFGYTGTTNGHKHHKALKMTSIKCKHFQSALKKCCKL